jgi:uncharacterized caspase-like protein
MLHLVAVGIDQYKDSSIAPLRFARADAEAFGAMFERGIHPTERQVTYLLDGDATHDAIRDVIGEQLVRTAVEHEDVVVMYFAGHGSPETDGSPDRASRYLITHDTQYEKVYATGIDMERDLPRWFNRLPDPRLIVMFLDTCFSGRAGGRTFEGPGLKHARAEHRSASPVSLKSLELGEGRIMISACDDDEVARESSDLGHGLFTHALIQSLRSARDDDTISIAELYDRVARDVRLLSKGRQCPVVNGRNRAARLPLFDG